MAGICLLFLQYFQELVLFWLVLMDIFLCICYLMGLAVLCDIDRYCTDNVWQLNLRSNVNNFVIPLTMHSGVIDLPDLSRSDQCQDTRRDLMNEDCRTAIAIALIYPT